MSVSDVLLEGRPIKLGRRIGRGGEGDIYEIEGDAVSAAKIYTVADGKDREPKVGAMIGAALASKSKLASFPDAIVRDRRGSFLGFRMRLVRDHKPLHDLYSPGPRKHHFPHADYRFLVRTAANLSRAVASVHSSGCVIGDINHSGALISPKATVALIDADSFQFSAGAQTFFCKVGVPEYTPPELQGRALGTILRTPNHDCFGLAVIIFQLLFMGRHPFVGTVRRGEIPPLHEAIRDYRFVYTEGRNVGMDQPPGTPALTDFALDIGSYFEAAFGQSTKDRRPTATEWVHALDSLEGSLVPCSENKLHFAPREADECPWCHMESQLGAVLFVPFIPAAKYVEAVDPGAAAFNIDTIWKQISAITISPRSDILPKLSPVAVASNVPASEPFYAKFPIARVASGVAAVAVIALWPKFWLIAVGLGLYALLSGRSTKQDKTAPLRHQFTAVQKQWTTELVAWHRRIGVDDFMSLQQRLSAARDEYIGLDTLKRRELDSYKSQRRQKQLIAFLDNFEIRNARIKGIGAAKQAGLASFGIDTAADVTKSKVLAVPGIGNSIAQDLLRWRAACEARFVYLETPNQADVQEMGRIASIYSTKAAALRLILSAGPVNLSALRRRVIEGRNLEDPLLNRIASEREFLKRQFQSLGAQPPDDTVDWSTTVGGSNTLARGAPSPSIGVPLGRRGSTTSSTSVTPNCPRCNSGMIRRVARRGRNAGGSFWGCSRYPVCRGTRNI